MTYSFSLHLHTALHQVLIDQQAQRHDPVSHAHNAVFVCGSMDAEYYLTLDGQVLWRDEETPLPVAIEPYHIHATLLKAAERFDLPELAGLVPSKPVDAVVCQACHGTRRIVQIVFCPRCAATGWIEAPT